MSYEQLPEGTYTGCSIPVQDSLQIVFGESSKKGTPYARVRLGITEGDEQGKSIFHDLYLTEKTIEKTIKSLRALGFTGDRLTDFMDQKPSNEVQFEIAHEEYGGRVRAKVTRVGAAPKLLAPSELDAISDKFKDLLLGSTPPSESSDPQDEIPEDFFGAEARP